MAKISFIFVAIALTFSSSVLCQTDATYATSTSAPGYKIQGHVTKTDSGYQIPLAFNKAGGKKKGVDTFGKTITDLVVDVEYETAERLHVKISDKAQKQALVPDSPLGVERPKLTSFATHNANYDFQYTARPFSFKVIRKSDKEAIFDTTNMPLVFEDQYLELSTAIPNDANIYGFGEVTAPFKRTQNVTTIFARDNADDMYRNIYGSHPYYSEVRNGKAHGALLLSSHGMDVITTEGRITYKVIGGVLDFYFFVPKSGMPNDLSIAYTDLIGKPMMPAHWMLGWHHCRYGYPNISVVEDTVAKYKQANIPLQTAWVDIDYMDETKDFTVDNVNFPQDKMISFGEQLHKDGQNYVVMVDPAISANTSYTPYTRGVDMNVFIKNPDGKSDYIGEVWPGYTVFPDWWHPNTTAYWTKEIIDWVSIIGLDGLWVDMNEPSSFCLGSCGTGKIDAGKQPYRWTLPEDVQQKNHDEQEAALIKMGNPAGETRNLLYPKYAINNGAGNLSELTVAMTALHHGGVPHYDIHNLYGHAEGYITRNAMISHKPDLRPFVLTRSSFVGSGRNVGHWTGDNHSQWSYLKVSIANVLNMQMFGITYSGADVCGFNENATETLCTRWMELGAFYPFARNHNAIGNIDQAPYLWNSTAEASRIALGIRYAMLPYMYTLFEESNRLGTGVWRPLFFENPDQAELSDNDVQFLLGSSVLISPVVTENATTVDAQFPPGIWYDWYTYESTTSNKGVKTVTLDAPLTHIPIHIKGGSILPAKTPKYTVDETYATDYKLIIALDAKNEATGKLYIDDGNSLNVKAASDIEFTYKQGKLTASGKFGYSNPEKLGSITIIGQSAGKLVTANVNGKSVKVSPANGAAVVEDLKIDLTKAFSVTFK